MTNTPIQVTTDLNKILERIEQNLSEFRKETNQKLEKIDERLAKIEVAQARQEVEFGSLKEDVKEIKGTQKAQIWTLIGTIIAAILGILTALGRLLFVTVNP
jgi:hypothetical protein